MFFTNSSGHYQPYKSWKGGNGTYAARPGWSRPIEQDQNVPLAPFGKPNPLRHWRKQLQPLDNISRTGVEIPFNAPASTVYLGVNSNDCNCGDIDNGTGEVVEILDNKNTIFEQGVYVTGDKEKRVCISCNPVNKIIKSAQTDKLINPVNGQEPKRKYCYSSAQYLRQKCRTYDQRLSGGTNVPGSETEYYANSCEQPCGIGSRRTFTRNPSNKQFSVQGAVDSGSRIQRLKLNTINKAANGLRKEWGSGAANAAKYTANGATPYFIKSKNNICTKSLYHKNGNKTICN